MRKKADITGPSTLGGIIIAVLVGLVLFIFVGYKLVGMILGTSDREVCRLSVIAMAKTKMVGIESPFSKLDCKTQLIDIKKDGIYRNGKKENSLGKEPEETIKKVVANEMHDCWYEFGQGEFDPFSNLEGKSTCVICSEISFDETVRKQVPEIKEFKTFLEKENIPRKDISYWDYITKGEKGRERVLIGGSKEVAAWPIQTSKDYSIVFISDRESFGSNLVGGVSAVGGCIGGIIGGFIIGSVIGTPVIGGVIGTLFGATSCIGGIWAGVIMVDKENKPHTLVVYLTPSEEVPEVCEMLY